MNPAGVCRVSPGGFKRGNIQEPLTQSLMNELEHDHTPGVSIGCWEKRLHVAAVKGLYY